MKSVWKIIYVAGVISVPILTVIGGFHYFGFVKKQIAIEELMAQTDSAYYKGIASVCYKKNAWEYPCCVASVRTIIDHKAVVAEDGRCGGGVAEKLQCDGSYAWCLPVKHEVQEESEKKTCVTDADCVAATCCHATDVVNKAHAPSCADHMCTMSCETILDCGQGRPVCNDGHCEVQATGDSKI